MPVPLGQWMLLVVLLAASGATLIATVDEATAMTVAVLVAVATIGLPLCRATQFATGDPRLHVLGYFWLIKLGLTLFILYAGWIPQLDRSTSTMWGYDPQRYYAEAWELIQNDWSPDFLSLNYVGVLFYYAAIFRVLGHNPVIPALINCFITLLGSLYLIRVCYELRSRPEPRDWWLGWVLLLPELLWFDALTSRETLMGALLVVSLLTIAVYFARARLNLATVFAICGPCALAIAAVRTSMLLPIVAAVVVMALFVRQSKRGQFASKFLLAAGAGVLLVAAPVLANLMGAYDFDLQRLFQAATAASMIAESADFEWSNNSIGLLLVPEGPLQAILFLLPRMLVNLVVPLSTRGVSLDALVAGNWSEWQWFLCSISALINVLAMPFVLASLVAAIRNRKSNPGPLAIHICFWLAFMAVAGGNLIIVERYRVMVTPLFWACAWLGSSSDARKFVVPATITWIGFAGVGAMFYMMLKLL